MCRLRCAILYKYTVFGYSAFAGLAGLAEQMLWRDRQAAPQPTHAGDFEMDRIQNWFDQIMGIAHIEQRQRDRAREIFLGSRMCLAGLETPACWRRPARVSRLTERSRVP